MIYGYVVNNSGRGCHKFQQSFFAGLKIPLDYIYKLYEREYRGKFDLDFLEWLKENKAPEGSGYDIIVEEVVETEVQEEAALEEPGMQEEVSKVKRKKKTVYVNKLDPDSLTSKQIASLRLKEDNASSIINQINSLYKLRRALTICNKKAGKKTLVDLIKKQISKLDM